MTVIGNVGDDLDVLGLAVSPDLDSILYALAGLHDEERGWGRAGETWEALGTVAALGGEDWFRLGDRDLGLHLVRSQALRAGEPLSCGHDAASRRRSESRQRSCRQRTIGCAPGSTRRPAASRSRSGSSPAATATRSTAFASWARRGPAPGVLEALAGADAIVIAPSNPYVSIWPILAVEEIRAALVARRVPCVAVSPLVGGRAVKGPADRMLARMAGGTGPEHVAACYSGLIDALVVDESDPAGPLAVRRDRHADADDRPRRVAPAGGNRARGRGVRVAVGRGDGTGSFGQAVAKRLVDAGVEIVIGSRDAERAREAAEPLGAEGANNDDAVRGVDLVLFAVKADAAVDTARDLRQSIGSTPVLSVCAELVFGPGGVKPTPRGDVHRQADPGRARCARRRRAALARRLEPRRGARRGGRVRVRR